MTSSYVSLVAILALSAFADAQSVGTVGTTDMAVHGIYIEVQTTLSKLDTQTGVPGDVLEQEAGKIAHLVEVYLTNAGVSPSDKDVEGLITQVASTFNNLASLSALFDDAISLEAAKLDSAFILWDKLSQMAVDIDDPQKVYVILAAIHKTAVAIQDTVSQTTDIFHYINNGAAPVDTPIIIGGTTGTIGTIGTIGTTTTNTIPDTIIMQRRRRETTVTGHVEGSSGGGVSGGVSVSHSWRRRR